MFININRALSKVFGRDILGILNHSKNYFLGNVFAQALILLAMPVLTRILTPADYGLYQVFRSYAEIFIILLTLNFHGAISRYYYDAKPDIDEFLGTSLMGSGIILSLISLLFAVFPQQIAKLLTLPVPLVWLLLFLTYIKIVEVVFNQISVATKKSLEYSLVTNARAILILGFGIVFSLIIRQDKYYGLAIGQILGSALVAVYIFILIRKQVKLNPTREHLKFIAGYSFPLIPYYLSSIFIDRLDRILINTMLGAGSAGLYSFAYNIGMIVSVATDALNGAFVPDWFRLMREGKYDEVNKLTVKMFRLVLLIAVAAIFFSKEIFTLLSSKEYYEAVLILPLVIVGYVFDFLSKVYLRNLGLANKMVHASLLGIFAVVFNFGLNIVFLPVYGYIAAAYSTMATYIFITFFAWVTAKYILKQVVTPWQVFVPYLIYFFLFIGVYYLVSSLNIGLVYSIILKSCLMLLFGFGMVLRDKLVNKTT